MKLYSPFSVALATWLGSPIGGGILLAHNYKVLGRARPARYCFFGGILVTVVLITAALWMIPLYRIHSLALVDGGMAYGLARTLQGELFQNHVDGGGCPASVWRALGISLLSCIPVFVLCLCIGVVTGAHR